MYIHIYIYTYKSCTYIGNVRIADFGLAIQCSIANTQACGTSMFVSPEVLSGVTYGTQADMYSFGMCLLEMATNAYPYQELFGAYMHIYKHVYVCVCACMLDGDCVYELMHICIHVNSYIYIYTCIHIFTIAVAYTHTNTYAHIHTRAHTRRQ